MLHSKGREQRLTFATPFVVESGAVLPQIDIQYTTYGRLNEAKDNVIWVAHALTGNAAVHEWWQDLFGPGRLLDPDRYFIVCANMLGSCYGTTGPNSVNPATGTEYGSDFPLITIRDMVQVHERLRDHLGIERVQLGIGGSMGGQQLIEWAVQRTGLFEKLVLLATNAEHSPWGIAFNEAQRMALQKDGSGLEAARAIAMLSYRNYAIFNRKQQEQEEKLDGFRASSYQQYQGEKLRQRFDPHSYRILTKAMDSHQVGRGRGGRAQALKRIQSDTLIIGIASDILFPVREQEALAREIPSAQLRIIESDYGHDGFLVETNLVQAAVRSFLAGTSKPDRLDVYREKRRLQSLRLPGTEVF
jgi:homoserine O-acetyltransferase